MNVLPIVLFRKTSQNSSLAWRAIFLLQFVDRPVSELPVLFNFRILNEPNPPSAVNCFTESVGWPEAAAGDELRVNDVKS